MLLLLLLLPLLFKGILCPGPSPEAGHVLGPHHLAGQEPLSFRMIQIFSFANHSWVNTQGSGWLGEVQTHRWDSVLGTIVYQLPWSRGNFSKEELENIHVLLQLYFNGFPREVQAYSSQFQLECEFAIPSWFLPEGPDQVKMVYGLGSDLHSTFLTLFS
ncbi:PREDICTED: T-cell surface glycoprotein CD1e, membrane-associated-like, partial [Myotis brandtii]|uniref:T-cell surface glycoprotein CD1e, membrane-associated-like n=1 Tax=Myotis brandtii TaxID=109478 RepID=UPI0007045779